MDFVTHAAVGALVGAAFGKPAESSAPGQRERISPAGMGAIAALLPDLDHVLEWISATRYLHEHRLQSHSLLVVALLVLLSFALPGIDRLRRAVVIAGALMSHLLIDALTPFGTALAWPFSQHRVAWDGLPIVCPAMAVLALCGLMWAIPAGRDEESEPPTARAWIVLIILAAFIGMEVWVAARARGLIFEEGTIVLAVPAWENPLEARVIVLDSPEDGPETLTRYGVGMDGQPYLRRKLERWHGAGESAPEDADTRAFMADQAMSDCGRDLERFRVPAARVFANKVVFEDQQFAVVSEHRRPFEIAVPRDEDGVWGRPVLTQLALGLQPLFYFAVLLGTILIARGRRRN